MRSTRLFVSFLLFTLPTTGVLVACGSDDPVIGATTPDAAVSVGDASKADGTTTPPKSDSGTNPVVDSGSRTDSGGDSGTNDLHASAVATQVYVGEVATADGSATSGATGITYAWTVGTVPAGSAITTASLTGASTATPSFKADKVGAYELLLTAKAGTLTSSTTVKAIAIDHPVFFFHAEDDAGGGIAAASLSLSGPNSDGGFGTPVACFSSDAGTSLSNAAQSSAQTGADWWESPAAGTPSRAAFTFVLPTDSGSSYGLYTALSTSSCGGNPTQIDVVANDGMTSDGVLQPRLSPSGARVAYVRTTPNGTSVATIGFDGTGRRDVAPFLAFTDGGTAPDASFPAPGPGSLPGTRPVWASETSLAWIRAVGASSWQVVTAPDTAGSAPTILMTCTGDFPYSFDLLPNNEVAVTMSNGVAFNDPTFVINLFAYPITAGTKACGTPRNLSGLTSTGGMSSAKDFALSPDKTKIAFIRHDDGTLATDVRIVPVTGTSADATVVTTAIPTRGIRWVGNGAFLGFGADNAALDAGAGTGVAAIALDGGAARSVAAGPSTSSNNYAIGNGSSCSFGPAVGSGASLFGFASLLGLRLLRRRKSRK